jgi:hypothetical protein
MCLTVDIAHKILRTDSVIDFIQEKMERGGQSEATKVIAGSSKYITEILKLATN